MTADEKKELYICVIRAQPRTAWPANEVQDGPLKEMELVLPLFSFLYFSMPMSIASMTTVEDPESHSPSAQMCTHT